MTWRVVIGLLVETDSKEEAQEAAVELVRRMHGWKQQGHPALKGLTPVIAHESYSSLVTEIGPVR